MSLTILSRQQPVTRDFLIWIYLSTDSETEDSQGFVAPILRVFAFENLNWAIASFNLSTLVICNMLASPSLRGPR